MKNNLDRGFIFKSVFVVLVSVLSSGCDKNRNHPGWDYFPDMFYSTAYESYTKNPNFNDGLTMRVPAAGTVPTDYTPFEYNLDPESRIKAGADLVNPVLPSAEAVAEGKKVYTTFCFGCHGVLGDGEGHLFMSDLYPLFPASLIDETASRLKDGEIYHSITLGFGAMGAHGSQIRPVDRWNIILYIRSLQNEANKQLLPKIQE
jgi:mono/diheme cytochrome c family protein